MTRIKIVRVADLRNAGAIRFRVDRSTPMGNPYILGVHGNRETVIVKYENWLRNGPINDIRREKALREIDHIGEFIDANPGVTIELACFCQSPEDQQPLNCHARIIRDLLLAK